MIFARRHLRNAAAAQRSPRSRGSAVVFMILLMGVLVAGMVSSMAMLSGIQSQSAGVDLKRNAAFYAAEAGLQQCVWNMNNNPTGWLGQCPYSAQLPNGCTYTIFVVSGSTWPNPVTFRSVGLSADSSVSTQASITVIANTAIIPGLAIGGNLADNGALIVNGGSIEVVGDIGRNGGTVTQTTVAGKTVNVEAMGKLSSNGSFSLPGDVMVNGLVRTNGTVNIGGNLQAGGTITPNGTLTVGGSNTALSSPNLNFTAPTVDTAGLIQQAQANGTMMFGGNLSTPTFDFTASPNGIIYVNGNLSINGAPKIKGTGTLIVQGTLTLNGNIGASGTPPTLVTMNLVTTGNVITNGTVALNGALCVGGSLQKNGAVIVNGVVVVQTDLTANGAVTLTYGQAPSFIHYTGSGGSGSGQSSVAVSNFSGATY